MSIVTKNRNKKALLNSCHLVNSMEKYSYSLSKKAEDELKKLAYYSEEILLPSGRLGNAIALALAINDYIAAEFLIENAIDLNLSTENIENNPYGKSPCGLTEGFLNSLLTFESIDEEKIHHIKEIYPNTEEEKMIEYTTRQEESKNRLLEKISMPKGFTQRLTKKL